MPLAPGTTSERRAPSGSSMPLSPLLEHALRWGAPVAPLLVMMLLFLIFTPSSKPAAESVAFYLLAMGGACAGFLGCALVRAWDATRYQAACWGAAGLLEVAWVVLLVGYEDPGSPLAWLGSLLTGLSTAVLLALWLHVGQTTSLRCELAKVWSALMFAFVLHALFGAIPGSTSLGFLFPLLTGAPLALALRRGGAGEGAGDEAGKATVGAPGSTGETAGGPVGGVPGSAVGTAGGPTGRPNPTDGGTPGEPASERAGAAAASGRRARCLAALLARMTPEALAAVVPTSLLLAALGAGVCALGFGGQTSEYGLGLAGVALMGLALGERVRRPLSLAGMTAAPVATLALLYAAARGDGSPFSIYLAGFALFATWALLASRVRPGGIRLASMRRTALACLWVTLCVAAGLACASALAGDAGAQGERLAMLLAGALVTADYLWRAVALPVWRRAAKGPAEDAPQPAAPDAEALATTFGLSPREAQVASLLLENRSLSYVCSTLGLAPSTAKTHIRHVYEKLGVHSRSELQLYVEGKSA